MREAVIVSSVRTAVGKAYKGTLRATRPDDLAAAAIKAPMQPEECKPSRQIAGRPAAAIAASGVAITVG